MEEQDEQCYVPSPRAQSQQQRERFVTVSKTQQYVGKGAFLLQLLRRPSAKGTLRVWGPQVEVCEFL